MVNEIAAGPSSGPGPVEETAASQPVFSILCSAYRTEPYLAETIESVVAQTLTDWELVVVDNGMSDEIAGIVATYQEDPRIRLVRQENRGLGGGIDAAAAVATGRYLAVLDSDDLLMPQFCARTAAVLDADPAIDVVGIDAFLFEDASGRDLVRGYRRSVGITTRADVDHRLTLSEMIGGNVLYYTAAIRRDAWNAGGGYSCDTPKVEDLAMFLRLLAAGRDVRVLDERLARYRLRLDSVSRDPAQQDAFEDSLERAFVQATGQSTDPQVQDALDVTLRRIRYHQAIRRSRIALLGGDVRGARAQARRAFRQRRTARAAGVLAGLVCAPALLRAVHPVKQRTGDALAGLAGRLRRRGA